MRRQALQFALITGASSQFNLGGIISAEQSVQSNVIGLTSNIGGIATLAQSALSNVQSSNPTTASRAAESSDARPTTSSAGSASTPASTSRPSSTVSSSASSSASSISATSASSSGSMSSTSLPTSPSTADESTATGHAAAIASPTATSAPDDDSHRTNTLLEIILPTVLSGLTLIVLLGLIFWYCARRRSRRNRNSGMSHLYAAGSTTRDVNSPADMEERPESSLLQRASSPPIAPVEPPYHQGRGVTYVSPKDPGAPAYSIREEPSRPESLYPQQHGTPLSRFSASTSTNRHSVLAPSYDNGATVMGRNGHHSQHAYQPVSGGINPAELPAEQRSFDGEHPAYRQQTPPTRARTPPLQAMFPWFGPKSNARNQYTQPRNSTLHGRETSYDGPGGFDFAFNGSNHNSGSSEARTRESIQTPKSSRYSIPRKPVPM